MYVDIPLPVLDVLKILLSLSQFRGGSLGLVTE